MLPDAHTTLAFEHVRMSDTWVTMPSTVAKRAVMLLLTLILHRVHMSCFPTPRTRLFLLLNQDSCTG